MRLHYPGNALARYREQTEMKGSSMNGVMAPSFRCAECGRSREGECLCHAVLPTGLGAGPVRPRRPAR